MHFKVHVLFALGSAFFFTSSEAQATSQIADGVPNWEMFGCTLCHVDGSIPQRNTFGMAVDALRSGTMVDWATLSAQDTDSDSYSNGDELGDPDGDGTAIANFTATDPGIQNDTPCGNGSTETPEPCDGSNLNGQTCADLAGFSGGQLACALDCLTFDTSQCTPDNGNTGGNNGTDPMNDPNGGGCRSTAAPLQLLCLFGVALLMLRCRRRLWPSEMSIES